MSSMQLAFVDECGGRVSPESMPHCSSAKDRSTYYLLKFGSLIRLTLRDYGSVLATVMARMELPH